MVEFNIGDTVEISFKESFMPDFIYKKRGFVIEYDFGMLNKVYIIYNYFYISTSRNDCPIFIHGITNVSLCRMVLIEKFDEKMESALVEIKTKYLR